MSLRKVQACWVALAVVTLAASSGCTSSTHTATEPPEPARQQARDQPGPPGDTPAPAGTATRRDALRDLSAALRADPVVAPLHIIGRVDRRDPAGPRFGWPGTQLRASFVGTGLSLDLADTGASHYDVSVDGGPPSLLIVSGGRKTYEVARDLGAREHSLVLTKRTETLVGVTQLLGIAPRAGGALLETPAPSGRRMELIGDSITCGFGVLGGDASCPFTAATESEPLAWGALAARRLAAIHTTTAVSGIGVFRNYGGATVGTMPEVYRRAIANDPSSAWDHSFVPDVIVVGLATNDFSGGQGDPGVAFQSTYVTFLTALRSTHPNAHIVVATSPMLSGANRTWLRAYLDAAVAERFAAGESRLTLLDIDEQDSDDGLGCQYHPSTTTQERMAEKLASHVRPLMGW